MRRCIPASGVRLADMNRPQRPAPTEAQLPQYVWHIFAAELCVCACRRRSLPARRRRSAPQNFEQCFWCACFIAVRVRTVRTVRTCELRKARVCIIDACAPGRKRLVHNNSRTKRTQHQRGGQSGTMLGSAAVASVCGLRDVRSDTLRLTVADSQACLCKYIHINANCTYRAARAAACDDLTTDNWLCVCKCVCARARNSQLNWVWIATSMTTTACGRTICMEICMRLACGMSGMR